MAGEGISCARAGYLIAKKESLTTSTQVAGTPSQTEPEARDRRLTVLAAILAASFVSTALHYTHNYIEVRHYPQSSLIPVGYDGTRLLITMGWPVLTAIGALGFWLYRRGRYPFAAACLAIYSLTGISTLAHFVDGSPHIAPFWYTTIFTDAFVGLAILVFVYADAVSRAGRSRISAGALTLT